MELDPGSRLHGPVNCFPTPDESHVDLGWETYPTLTEPCSACIVNSSEAVNQAARR